MSRNLELNILRLIKFIFILVVDRGDWSGVSGVGSSPSCPARRPPLTTVTSRTTQELEVTGEVEKVGIPLELGTQVCSSPRSRALVVEIRV